MSAGDKGGRADGDRTIRLIMAAVLVWGFLLAMGAYLAGMDMRKPVIVLAMVGLFLGGWGLLLWRSARKRGGGGKSGAGIRGPKDRD